jgi:membrane associated rhomboid family serine protease
MTLRTVAREIRDYPATACFSLIWIVVFGAMVALHLKGNAGSSWWRLLVLGIGDGHRFGDLTVQEAARGEVWRLITATFVHYSFVHISLNLLAFYLLGTLLESWYGSAQFVLIYGLTGGLGNLVSVLIRQAIGSHPLIHSGGGSVVVMGLIGLCAIVGWRSKTAMGSDLGWQMLKALGLTGLLGIAFPRYIDNWGHAGGALVGFPLGFFHGWFIRQRSRPAAWGLGVMTGLLIASCGLAQLMADRRESRSRADLSSFLERKAYYDINRALGVIALLGERDVDARVVVEWFNKDRDLLDRGAMSPAFRRAGALAEAVQIRVLSQAEQEEFDRCLAQLCTHLLKEMEPFFDRDASHDAYHQLSALAAEAETRPLADAEKDVFKSRLGPLKDAVRRELEPRIRELWKNRARGSRPS